MTVESSFSIEDSKYDDDGSIKRTGTSTTASAHIVTAVIGSGVLSLAWAYAQLGWIAGTAVLLLFAVITYFTSSLLCDCYRYPDPVHGTRNPTYTGAVKAILGGYQSKLLGLAQYTNIVGCTIGYTLTASISIAAIKKANCFHKYGHEADCDVVNYPYMVIFGLSQIILSQIPNFHEISWLSIVAAVMSFGYASIGIGLSIVKIAEKGHIWETSLTGLVVGVDITSTKKIWNTFQALGNIAFAYTFSVIILEIEDTLKSSPPEHKTMRKSSLIGVLVTTFFYALCGILGYAAFGNDAPGNFLTGFGFYEPFWLVDIGNLCIIIHLAGAYQVFAQPLFSLVENWGREKWPQSKLMTKEYNIKIPLVGIWRMNMFRLIWRTMYVMFTTLLAILLPFFNSVVGLIGALSFFPLTVYFPTEMYLVRTKTPKYSSIWIGMKLLSLFCLVLSIVAAFSSIQGILSEIQIYKPFG